MTPDRSSPQPLRLHLLGGATLRGRDGETTTLERKAAALLAFLTLEGATPRGRLAGLLWPERDEGGARNNLRQLLYKLRAWPGLLQGRDPLAPGEGVWVDAGELHGRLVRPDGRWAAAAPLARAGELLEGLRYDDCPAFEEWLLAVRERFRQRLRESLELEADRLEQIGDYRPALTVAERLADLDDLSENAFRRLMRLHYLRGDRAAALAAYERCRRALAAHLGVEPLPETVELARAIDRLAVAAPEAAAPHPPVELQRPPRLVGRERAWQQLEDAWLRSRTIFVVGDGGVGKTRLARDFAASRGVVFAFEGREGDRPVPYATLTRTLRQQLARRPELAFAPWVETELGRILPERDAGAPAPIASEAERLRFAEAMATVRAALWADAHTLLVDDLHHFDDASFGVGSYFASRFARGELRAISTFRPLEMPRALLAQVERLLAAGLAVMVRLEPLGVEAVERLLVSLALPDPPDAARLHRLTGGNPFFLVESLKQLSGPRPEAGAGVEVPARVEAVLDARLQRLPTAERQVLQFRALAGEGFSAELAAEVLELELVAVGRALAELEARQFLLDGAFAHELLEAHTRRSVAPDVAWLWHRRIAAGLAARDAAPHRVARHHLAGREPGRAHRHLLRAAARAQAVYALEDAKRWAFVALWAAGDDPARRAAALLRLDDVLELSPDAALRAQLLDELTTLAERQRAPGLRFEALLRRAHHLQQLGRPDAAATGRRALALASELGDAALEARARLLLAGLAQRAGEGAPPGGAPGGGD